MKISATELDDALARCKLRLEHWLGEGGSTMKTLMGYPIIESYAMTESVEDWSRCRSPSRAMRRRRQGHPQNVVYVERPKPDVLFFQGKIYVHPETLRRLQKLFDDTVSALNVDYSSIERRIMAHYDGSENIEARTIGFAHTSRPSFASAAMYAVSATGRVTDMFNTLMSKDKDKK